MMERRAGFTLVELMIVLVIGLAVLAAAGDTLVRQERAYSYLRAVAGTQEDTRAGVDLLAAELREISPGGGDLIMATPDSLRFRALRTFGLVCSTDKNNKRFTVAQRGADPFASGDSIAVYVDGDSLKAADDAWQTTALSGTSSLAVCTTTLGVSLGTLLPGSNLVQITVVGAGLRWDSIYPGAPIRAYEQLTYRVADVDGEPTLVRVRTDTISPLIGPLTATNGLRLRYFDGQGTELTSFPLDATARESVRRIRMELRAERRAGQPAGSYVGMLMTDIHTRGS